MPPNLDSPEVIGPRKRTLSTKVTSNGDPVADRQKKKLKMAQEKAAIAAPTKKRPPTTAAATAAPSVATQLSATSSKKNTAPKASAKPALQDGSDDNSDIEEGITLTYEPISVLSDNNDDSGEKMDGQEKALEAPEESAEAELGKFSIQILETKLTIG